MALLPAPAVMTPPEMVQTKVLPTWGGTETVRPLAPAVTLAGSVKALTGTGLMAQVAAPGALARPAPLVTVQPRLTLAEVPAVKVMALLPAPAVMTPPEIVQTKVLPAWAGTVAARPVALAVTLAGAVMVALGAAKMAQVAEPGALAWPAPLVTVQPRLTLPEAPAVKVMALLPAPAVMAPPEIVQTKVLFAWAGTEAASPVALAVTLAGAVMVALGAAKMAQVAVPALLAAPAALLTTQLSWTEPEAPAEKVMALLALPAVMAPPVIVQA